MRQRVRYQVIWFGVAVLLLSGCANKAPINVITSDQMASALDTVKAQVAEYQSYVAYQRRTPPPPAAPLGPCGGRIDFDIKSISLSITQTADNSLGGNVGVTVPVTLPAGSFGGGLNGSTEANNTQTLTLNLLPVAIAPPSASPPRPSLPLGVALINLRDALINVSASGSGQCFDFDTNNLPVFSTGVTFTKVEGGNLSLTLGVFTLGATLTHQSVSGNNLTVTFGPLGPARFAIPLGPGRFGI